MVLLSLYREILLILRVDNHSVIDYTGTLFKRRLRRRVNKDGYDGHIVECLSIGGHIAPPLFEPLFHSSVDLTCE